MQAHELKGRGVLALSNAKNIGQVADVLFDAQFRQVMGFRIKRGGLFHKAQAIMRDSVTAVGSVALTVESPDAVNDEERFPDLAHTSTLSQMEQMQVVTESGDLLGMIAHLELDDQARQVVAYTLVPSLKNRLLRHTPEVVQADEVLRLGEGGLMVVSNAAGTRLKAARG